MKSLYLFLLFGFLSLQAQTDPSGATLLTDKQVQILFPRETLKEIGVTVPIRKVYAFKDKLNLQFFDEYSSYYFIPKNFSISDVKGKMISLMPFPIAKNIETKGLKWPLNREDLILGERIGTRNIAENKDVTIKYKKGDLLIFVGN